jgi:hypothetical protein
MCRDKDRSNKDIDIPASDIMLHFLEPIHTSVFTPRPSRIGISLNRMPARKHMQVPAYLGLLDVGGSLVPGDCLKGSEGEGEGEGKGKGDVLHLLLCTAEFGEWSCRAVKSMKRGSRFGLYRSRFGLYRWIHFNTVQIRREKYIMTDYLFKWGGSVRCVQAEGTTGFVNGMPSRTDT